MRHVLVIVVLAALAGCAPAKQMTDAEFNAAEKAYRTRLAADEYNRQLQLQRQLQCEQAEESKR